MVFVWEVKFLHGEGIGLGKMEAVGSSEKLEYLGTAL